MAERDEYRSKLRTPKKEIKSEPLLWGRSSPAFDQLSTFGYSNFLNTPSPAKTRVVASILEHPSSFSPHKSGYFLRTPSPFKQNQRSPQKLGSGFKQEVSGTPSPHKTAPGTDLFGNRSLLDNLPMPEWDEHFLDNFQEDLLFGIGSEDIEGLVRSPLKSPKRGHTFLSSSPLKNSPSVSPFKSPLLTSSPKLTLDSPSNFLKTPDLANGRPLTRQRKLFLQSPERQMPSVSGSNNWARSLPFSSLDETSSSMFSDGHETTTSIQSISYYLRGFEDGDQEDDYAVMPPVGWETQNTSEISENKFQGKGKRKCLKFRNCETTGAIQNIDNATEASVSTVTCAAATKKVKAEPQFTLLRPHTELHSNQICLRLTTGTPPNKIKISRDFSQIQTLPSKEQLRIVRNRFRETLNKAVEQVIEKEKAKKSDQEKVTDPTLRSALQRPALTQAAAFAPATSSGVWNNQSARKPQLKKRKRCTT